MELVQLLNNMLYDESRRVIHKLRDESDARIILSVMRRGMDGKQRPSKLSTVLAIMNDSLQILELATHFPTAYPHLVSSIPIESTC
jgi:hypothetical protein